MQKTKKREKLTLQAPLPLLSFVHSVLEAIWGSLSLQVLWEMMEILSCWSVSGAFSGTVDTQEKYGSDRKVMFLICEVPYYAKYGRRLCLYTIKYSLLVTVWQFTMDLWACLLQREHFKAYFLCLTYHHFPLPPSQWSSTQMMDQRCHPCQAEPLVQHLLKM